MKRLFYLLSIVCCLSSCSSGNKDKTPVLGHLDTLAIAMDTTMQLGFESSYEFHKTLTVTDTLVYDVIAFGGPATKGEVAILRRGAANKTDTVFKDVRTGIIADTWLADSNNNKKPEVYIAIKGAADNRLQKLVKYEK
ncbi:MAG: hypothetical protein RLZZ367_2403 [Bacteroidota bacterium]|jgi:hypothetical protein